MIEFVDAEAARLSGEDDGAAELEFYARLREMIMEGHFGVA